MGSSNKNITGFSSESFGAGFNDGFSATGISGVSILIRAWYDSLITKPSVGLLSSLNLLAQTLSAGGVWGSLDFLSVIAGMETNEQRLRPLITASGSDILNVSNPTLDVNGVTGNGSSSYLDLKFNLVTQAVNYTVGDASLGHCKSTNGTSGRSAQGTVSVLGASTLTGGTGVLTGNVNGSGNQTSSLSGNGYRYIRRFNTTSVVFTLNGVDGPTLTAGNAGIVNNGNQYACCRQSFNGSGVSTGPTSFDTATYRHFFYGSSFAASNDILRSALNAFYASRGLSTF